MSDAAAPAPAPATGRAIAALAGFDTLIADFQKKHEIPGGAFAVGRDGRVLYARGYGLADRNPDVPVSPNSWFRLASVSKPMTAHAVLRLVDRGVLRLEDRLLDRLPAELAGLKPADARWESIRIEHLLQHTAGWDRDKSHDPMFESREIARELGVASPPGPLDIVRRQATRPLDFAPGERYAYSNFGYLLLARILETATGRTYGDAVRDLVWGPVGLADWFRLGRTAREHRLPREVGYFDGDRRDESVFDPSREQVARPYGTWCLEAMDGHGGWVGTAPALVKWSMALARPEAGGLRPETWWRMWERPAGEAGWKEGKPRETFYGHGWQIRPASDGQSPTRWHHGSLDGTSTLLVHRHDGLCWALLFNSRRTGEKRTPTQMLDSDLHRVAKDVKEWPTEDLWRSEAEGVGEEASV